MSKKKRPAVIDTSVILGYYEAPDSIEPEYSRWMSRLQWFYTETIYNEVLRKTNEIARDRGEQISNATVEERASHRLKKYTEIPRSPEATRFSKLIRDRLRSSCLTEGKIEKMAEDIMISAETVSGLKMSDIKALCLSHNYDFLQIKCALPEDLEVWSVLDESEARPSCAQISKSLLENQTDLSALK